MKLYGLREGENLFRLCYTRNIDEKLTLKYYLEKYNIENYWIYKGTNVFRNLILDDLLNEKYYCYIFFHKHFYNKDEIDKSIEILYNKLQINPYYLFEVPSLEILQKIKIIEKI